MAETSNPGKGRGSERGNSTPRTPRRAVLLAGAEQSEVVEVLREYLGAEISGKRIHEDARRFADANPGKMVAVEWQGPLGWTRFLWCKRPESAQEPLPEPIIARAETPSANRR